MAWFKRARRPIAAPPHPSRHLATLPYLAILTDPTTGGVTASFAMLADISIAEPKALIGFVGLRVIEQTIHPKPPAGFLRGEFLLEHGMEDLVVDRRNLKSTAAKILRPLGSQDDSVRSAAAPA